MRSESSNEEIARVVIGSGMLRRRRLRHLVLAHLLRERAEGQQEDVEADDDSEGAGDQEQGTLRLLLASRMFRRPKLRRMLLAHLFAKRARALRTTTERPKRAGGDEDRNVVRSLVAAGLLRRRRVRQMLLAHALRDRQEGEDGGESVDQEDEKEEDGDPDRRLVRMLIGTGLLRRARRRRFLLAYLLRAHRMNEDQDDAGDEEKTEIEEDEGEDDGRQAVRALIASGALRRVRTRRLILAHVLRGSNLH